MNWNEIKGQEINLRALREWLSWEQGGHAVLLTGPPGSGKSALAILIAQALNCENKDQAPCGWCSCCYRINRGTFPEVVTIEPEGRWIKIEQVREVHQNLNLRLQEGNFRVCLMEEAHTLTREAAASWLKSLEEPGEDVKYILTSSLPSRMLPTIVSRCAHLKLKRLTVKQVNELLQFQFPEVSAEKIEFAARISQGLPGRAREVLTDDRWESRYNQAGDLVGRLFRGEALEAELLQEAQEWSSREDLASLLEMLVMIYRDGLLSSYGLEEETLTDFFAGQGKKETGGVSTLYWKQSMELIEETQKVISTTNASVQLALEAMFLSLKRRMMIDV